MSSGESRKSLSKTKKQIKKVLDKEMMV